MEKEVTKKKVNRYNEDEVRKEMKRLQSLKQENSRHYSYVVKRAKQLGVFIG